ncbi:MAG: peptidylprolyl isomerase [Rubripirellula sp.]
MRTRRQKRRTANRLGLQSLEPRRLLAGDLADDPNPVFETLGEQTVLVGSPLHLPIDASDLQGGELTVTVEVADDSLLEASVIEGNRSLRISVANFGDMVFELFEQRAPDAAGRVIELAENDFYDGIIFHRVIDEFIIQAGDPAGTGVTGSSLPNFDDDFHRDLQHNRSGVLSFAKSSDDTNNSQFFVTETPTRHLDFNHSVFGQLVEGEAVRDAISDVSTGLNDRPVSQVVITNAEVFEDIENSLVMLKGKEGASGMTSVTLTVTDQDGNTYAETIDVTVEADTENSQPFFDPIDLSPFPAGTPAVVQLAFTDIEGDPVEFATGVSGNNGTASVDASGLLTVTPADGFVGTLQVAVGVRPGPSVFGNGINDADLQLLDFEFVGQSLDLEAGSDSGTSNSDNITNQAELTFLVSGTRSGSVVDLVHDGVVVGTANATGVTTQITTLNVSALGDGEYDLIARETIDGVATQIGQLTVVYDATSPEPTRHPMNGHVVFGETYRVDLNAEEEGAGLTYSLSSAPDFVSIGADTGEIVWTPIELQVGSHTFTLVLTDPAGNTTEETFQVEVSPGPVAGIRLQLTDLEGNEISSVVEGQAFQMKVFAIDHRNQITRDGVFAAYADILFEDSLVRADSIEFDQDFSVVDLGVIEPGKIDELGAVTNLLERHQQEEVLIATVQMTAVSPGTALLESAPAAESVLVFGYDDVVTPNQISYGRATIEIASIYHRPASEYDVNGDGDVTAVDALVVLNAISRAGGTIAIGSDAAGGLNSEFAYNVTNDLRISSLDALAVINQLARLDPVVLSSDAEEEEALLWVPIEESEFGRLF